MDQRMPLSKSLIFDSVSKVRNNIAEKRAKRLARGKKVRVVKATSDFKAIMNVYAFLYIEKFKACPDFWGAREFSQCKNLIKKLGADRSEKLIRYVFKNWEWVSREIGLSGAPMIGDILGRCIRYESAEGSTEESEDGYNNVARIKI